MSKDLKFKLTVLIVLVLICLPIGGYLLSRGITGITDAKTQEFAVTDGYYAGCEPYSADSSTYYLIYTYSVDGAEYQVRTDYGTAMIPKPGSVRQVRYDPASPENAALTGPDAHLGLIFGGVLFILVPLIVLWGWLLKLGIIKKGFKLLELFIGLTLMLGGIFALYFIGGGFSVVQAFETAGLLAVIPVLLILFGVLQLLGALVPKK